VQGLAGVVAFVLLIACANGGAIGLLLSVLALGLMCAFALTRAMLPLLYGVTANEEDEEKKKIFALFVSSGFLFALFISFPLSLYRVTDVKCKR
jgi:hypothetical protein